MKRAVSLALILVIVLGCVSFIACGGGEKEAPPPNGGTPSPATGEATSPTPATEAGLVAYYPFDGDTKDLSGNRYDGTNHGATFVSGYSGQALSFNGKDNFVQVPVNINPIVLPQMTMAAWVKPTDASPIRQVISHDDGGYDRAMGIDRRGGGTGWSAFSGSGHVLGYHPVTIGEWVFIATVYDQDAGTVRLYVDGATYEKEGKIVGGGRDYILIGANGSPSSPTERFLGTIDEVKIYDYALSVSELKSLYETGTARPETTSTPASTPTSTPTSGGALENILARGEAINCYQYDMVITHPGGSPVITNIWIKGNKSRTETTIPEMGKMIMIMDKDTKTLYTIRGNMAMKMVLSAEEMESPMDEPDAILDFNPIVIGSETVDGKKCTIVEYTVEGKKTKMWIWNNHGMPIKMETKLPEGMLRIENKNISFDCASNNMFELPPGVKITGE